ncbi:MAG: CAP domain-containing protein [Bacteroidales bacterium]|nr:CAP domain-containing protein [Bacteroidales bacterium]
MILALLLPHYYVSYSQSFKGIPEGTEDVEIQNLKFEIEVLDLVNEIRIKQGVEVLVWHEDLARAARYHAQDMANDDYMEHQTYDRNKNQLFKVCETFERIQKFIKMSYLAENISAGKTNAKETVDAWMKSKSHHDNILNPNFKFLGVGYYYKKNTKYLHYWVQDFGG